jgi:hypothetical protein
LHELALRVTDLVLDQLRDPVSEEAEEFSLALAEFGVRAGVNDTQRPVNLTGPQADGSSCVGTQSQFSREVELASLRVGSRVGDARADAFVEQSLTVGAGPRDRASLEHSERLTVSGEGDENAVIAVHPRQERDRVVQLTELQAFDLMNGWLDGLEADSSSQTLAQKVVSDKPSAAVDRCTTAGAVPIPCVIPPSGSPRLGAGEPITNDTWQCQLKPLSPADFPTTVSFTPGESSQLKSAFPTGVCDYSKPGVDQQPTVPWLTYQGPQGRAIYGGRPLGPAPVSIPFG